MRTVCSSAVLLLATCGLLACGGSSGGAGDGAVADGGRLDAARDGAPGDGGGDVRAEDAAGDGSTPDAARDGTTLDAATDADDGGGTGDGGQDAAGDAPQQDSTAQQDTGSHEDGGAQQDSAPQQDSSPQQDAGGAGEVWVQIDYTNAYTPESPGWSFSSTPGWGAAQWAMTGDTWPEAWDRFNDMTVSNDPIGRALIIGPSSELQLMIGLEELVAYTAATVRLEGRSYSTSASVLIDVYNPWNGCGIVQLAQMSNDWTVHVVDLDFDSCLAVGQGVQAVRVVPAGGSDAIALVRMRVTMQGAVW